MMLNHGVKLFLSLLLLCVCSSGAAKEPPLVVKIAHLTEEKAAPPALSNLDPILTDEGVQGSRLAINDNNTTGRFTNQEFILHEVSVPVGGDVLAAFKKVVAGGYGFVVVNVSASSLKQMASLPEAQQVMILNASVKDDELRNAGCSRNVLHLIPSRAMQTDALGQFLLKKRWRKWFLVVGQAEGDRQYAASLKRTAKQFGMKIVAEKTWSFEHDARRTVQAEVPAFTQGAEYDVLVVADEQGLFGEYINFQTWLPRPVVGTQGLVATAWHRTHERWGAVQMQNRFNRQANRWMTEEDYASWLAVRVVGEAATRTKTSVFKHLRDYILSDRFSLGGFKGVKLTFRAWNGQLRQPVLLASPRSLVGVMPLREVLHPKTYLDTLGFDEPQSSCRF